MNPSANNERASISLPPPVAEQVPENAASSPTVSVSEVLSSSPEASAQVVQAPALNLLTQVPTMPSATSVMPQDNVTNTTNSTVPDAADDADLIEKDWVTKAKKIVEKTLEDPYQQSKELTIFKADYMKKRYNKTIKLSE